ncbi:MAG: PD-(D/E)XK nuclease family protein [Thermomicrobiales bacterium]|nr:PD-(D/E)XK nuclease family protein [Thermomicrobiales bacterium]
MATLQLVTNSNNRPPRPAPQQLSWKLPTYSPTALNQYRSCPEAFLHERLLRTPAIDNQSRGALIKGTATHVLLDRYIALGSTDRIQFEADVARQSEQALIAEGMPTTDPGFLDAAAQVESWVTNGLHTLQNTYDSALLLIGEQFLDLRWVRDSEPFRLTAKIDLLALFPDGSVESLDWKTGSSRSPDRLQNVVCRLVAEANASKIFATHLSTRQPTAIRTTVFHLDSQTLTSQEFTRSQLIAEFSNIRAQISRIERAKATPVAGTPDWRAQPGPLCSWCKYQHACSHISRPPTDEIMSWLDEDAGLST